MKRILIAGGYGVVGRPLSYTSRGSSGGDVVQAFCRDCGTPLWGMSTLNSYYSAKMGAFDDHHDMKPGIHTYTEAAPAWHSVLPDLPNVRGMPVVRSDGVNS